VYVFLKKLKGDTDLIDIGIAFHMNGAKIFKAFDLARIREE